MFFMGLQYGAEIRMNSAIERQSYNTEKTITLKIPVSLPYQIYADGFKRVQGEFEHEGTFYNLIEQKIANDTLYIVCVENEIKSQIKTKQVDFEKAANDWPGATKSAYNLLISFSKDFLQNASNNVGLNSAPIIELSYLIHTFDTLEGIHETITPPPKRIS